MKRSHLIDNTDVCSYTPFHDVSIGSGYGVAKHSPLPEPRLIHNFDAI